MSLWSVCVRKVRHRTKANAEKALANQIATMPPALLISKLVVYECPHCRGWHVGSYVAPVLVERSKR
jgi:hypothetical protein